MLAFGFGTLPALLGISVAGFRLSRPQAPLARLIGTIIVACGLWTAAAPMASLARGQPHVHHLSIDHRNMAM
jgi:sulfite exporter TauE/SafE